MHLFTVTVDEYAEAVALNWITGIFSPNGIFEIDIFQSTSYLHDPYYDSVSCVLHHSFIFQKLAHGGLIRNAAFLVPAEKTHLCEFIAHSAGSCSNPRTLWE